MLTGLSLWMIGVNVRPQTVLVPKGLATVLTGGLLLLRVPDLEMFLEVGAVADRLVTDRAWARLVRVVF